MKELKDKYWKGVYYVTSHDDSVEAPDETIQRSLDIFQPSNSSEQFIFSRFFPKLAAVRDAGPAQKLHFKVGTNCMVQIEWESIEEDQVFLKGFIYGFDASQVTLYNDDKVYFHDIEAGSFVVDAIPSGTYSLSFETQEDSYWIESLDLKKEPSNL